MIRLPQLDADAPAWFPDPRDALGDPNGLLAFGGDLSPERLLAAYAQGIFPWFGEGEPILWWSPDPRCVFRTDALKVNRSLRRQLQGKKWRVTADLAFDQVVRACAAPRAGSSGTWIVPAMIDAYVALHRLGHAHSVEVWENEQLIGGIYGVSVGRLFCGESMFSARSGASRLALVTLARLLHQLDCPLLDAQVANAHTLGLGAMEIPRTDFLRHVERLTRFSSTAESWTGLLEALPPVF